MSLADRARREWTSKRERTVRLWGGDADQFGPLADAVDRLARSTIESVEPVSGRVRVPRDWEAAVVDVRDDDLELVGRRVSDSPIAYELHAVGRCRACHATVPLDPPVTDLEELGAALEYAVPAAHDCLGYPPAAEQR